MKRRDFLTKTSKAVALAAVTGTGGWLFHGRQVHKYESAANIETSFTVLPDTKLPQVVLARNEDHLQALNQSLDAIGGIKRFISPGDRVVLKPNVGWDRAPAQAADTNPVLVGEMVRLCLAAGATEVVVSDVTCNDARRCFLRSGIREATEKAGGKAKLEADEDFITIDMKGEMLTSWPVLKHFVECDKLINMPIAKHHSLSSCTIGMKNLYGIIGGSRHRLHQQIDQSIVDLARFCTPTLTIVDATRVLLRGGPQGGSLDDVSVENSVICATDQVAADSRAAEFIGLRGSDVGHIVLAEKTGLGLVDYNQSGYKEIT